MYQLYYWPGLPGRGEFVRLVLEQANIPYDDIGTIQGFEPIAAMKQSIAGFAPPYFVHNKVTIAQMPAICMYLGKRHNLWPTQDSSSARALQLLLTISDTVSEIHDLHHPISIAKTYEQQQEFAKQCAIEFHQSRLQQWIGFYTQLLKASNWLVDDQLSAVDLCLFQLCSGIEYAFPNAYSQIMSHELIAHKERVSKLQPLCQYLKSERRQSFNENGIFRYYPELDK